MVLELNAGGGRHIAEDDVGRRHSGCGRLIFAAGRAAARHRESHPQRRRA
jgi:hypothetical protein